MFIYSEMNRFDNSNIDKMRNLILLILHK